MGRIRDFSSFLLPFFEEGDGRGGGGVFNFN